MEHVKFDQIRNDEDLARNFGCKVNDLRRLTEGDQRLLYLTIRIPKRGAARRGQYRIVYKALDQTLRLLQKNLASSIAARVTFADHVQGFVARRSIVTNARRHLARKYVLTADIENFFESITIERVAAAFRGLGCHEGVAQTLATLATLNGHLVQGSSASPVLANLVCEGMDADLLALGGSYDCTFTRYADDITLSGDERVPSGEEIADVLARHAFVLRDGRVRVLRRGRRQYVTGLSVFDAERPRIPRVHKRRLRLLLHYASKHGLEKHFERIGIEPENRYRELRRMEGWIQFMRSVEPRRAAEFAAQLDDARAADARGLPK
ncbi:MAG: RNA-directed DNA polymerase [Deltaproteobacteria bacterium]|nr:MAG: RNA-directed DNA polymerase [Deltaproteobacteria bacterium]TMB12144.1 MAG: RNA-directed DNA polymerase [Deltaproteobacteria bacterium]